MKKPTTPVSSKDHSAELIAELGEFLAKYQMTQEDVASRVGLSGAVISNYLKGKYTGDVPKLEASLRAMIAQRRASRSAVVQLVRTSTVDGIVAFLSRISRLGSASILYGAHGCGKTAGICQFLAESPTTIYVALAKWNGNIQGVERALMSLFSTSAWQKSGKCRGDFIRDELHGTQRMMIIDDADRLTPSAKTWILDMLKHTGGSGVFVCGPTGPDFATSDVRTREAIRFSFAVDVDDKEAVAATKAIVCAQFPELLGFCDSLASVTLKNGIATAVALASLAMDLAKHSKRQRSIAETLTIAATTCGVTLPQTTLVLSA